MSDDAKPVTRTRASAAPEPESADVLRALKCPACNLRDAVVANIKAGVYSREGNLEADLAAQIDAYPVAKLHSLPLKW